MWQIDYGELAYVCRSGIWQIDFGKSAYGKKAYGETSYSHLMVMTFGWRSEDQGLKPDTSCNHDPGLPQNSSIVVWKTTSLRLLTTTSSDWHVKVARQSNEGLNLKLLPMMLI